MIDNSELIEEMFSSKDVMSKKLVILIKDLSIHYCKKQFENTKIIDEYVNHILNTIDKNVLWKGFNPKKSDNAIAYMAQIIKSIIIQKRYREPINFE